MKNLLYLFLLVFSSCTQKLSIHIEEGQFPFQQNNKYIIVFEKYFTDSISIKYNKKIVFDEYVKTIKRIEASDKICTIMPIHKMKHKIFIKIGKERFYFCPNSNYRFYYINKFNQNIGITVTLHHYK